MLCTDFTQYLLNKIVYPMDRSKIIHEFFQNIGAMRRFFAHAPQAPEGMPTHAGLWVMMMLAHEEPLTIKELADRLTLSLSATSQLVKKLEVLDIVSRGMVPGKKKPVLLFTEKGKHILKKTKEQRMKLCENMLDVLSDKELIQLHALQTKVLNHLPSYGKA
jgi:DNA-binding MarR family transcriptional regulator